MGIVQADMWLVEKAVGATGEETVVDAMGEETVVVVVTVEANKSHKTCQKISDHQQQLIGDALKK